MLSFVVYSSGKLAESVNLAGAYVVGSDDVPLRADITFRDGIILCHKRAAGPAGLALLWDVRGIGRFMLETIRVVERDKPYVLQVELARGRLMRLNNKLEDWGLIDFDGAGEVLTHVDAAREKLIEALQSGTEADAAANGDEALRLAVQAGERMSKLHAEVFLSRRRQAGGFTRRNIGCFVHLDKPADALRKALQSSVDFVTLPTVWRDIEPTEQTFQWKPLDAWVEALTKDKVPLRASSLLSFNERNVPDWLYIWEHDFETIRDLAFEQVRRVIQRYGQHIQVWGVACGLHANNCFSFNFEQLLELTRMAVALTKQLNPRSTAILELVAPWGEYYARNQRTIPPLLYADMAVQSGVNFDAFGLRFHFGPAIDGMFVRDMFQISAMLDQFSKLGKPLHVTAVEVPSSMARATPDAPLLEGGIWHKAWDERTQAEWAGLFMRIALSKPFVESVSWHYAVDHPGQLVPHGGLFRQDLTPKPSLEELSMLRSHLASKSKGAGSGA